MKLSQFRKFDAGFTLIELLVVIAILSLLLAILLPSMNMARMTAKKIVCRMHLHQIDLGWEMYFKDHEGRFYKSDYASTSFGGWVGGGFHDLERPLNPYLDIPLKAESDHDAEVFSCPADKGKEGDNPPTDNTFDHYGNSYHTNPFLVGRYASKIIPPEDKRKNLYTTLKNDYPYKRDDVEVPDKVIFVGDHNWYYQIDPDFPTVRDWHKKPYCHNVVFLDSHIDFVNMYKGYYVSSKYRILHNSKLHQMALDIQGGLVPESGD